MNANTMRMAFGIYLVTALLGIPTIHAASPIKALESRVTENEADISANSALIADHEARITTNGSDINANSVLIDDNTIRINALRPSVSVRANGERIGTYLITNEDPSGGQPNQVTVMNDSEYIFSICLVGCGGTKNEGDLMWPNTNAATLIVYTTVDCTGQEYLLESQIELINGLGSVNGCLNPHVNGEHITVDMASMTEGALTPSFLFAQAIGLPASPVFPVFPRN